MGSIEEVTRAVLAIVPAAVGRTTICSERLSPTARSPSGIVTTSPPVEIEVGVPVDETNVTPAGMRNVRLRPNAGATPVLAMVTV